MAKSRKKSRTRKKKEGLAARGARLVNRVLILLTFGLIALYLLPLSTKILDDGDETAVSAPGESVTVQVLNGCGESGLALKVTRFLRSAGLDVVEMGNAENFHHERTKIVAKTENTAAAERVRGILGIGEVVSAPDSSLLLQVSVIIGSDAVPFPPRPAER
ncbi:MAG: LytR C-terminal domain-containing protein [Candidatus Eisenbacteria bacterium]